jgi:hypothetical protein
MMGNSKRNAGLAKSEIALTEVEDVILNRECLTSKCHLECVVGVTSFSKFVSIAFDHTLDKLRTIIRTANTIIHNLAVPWLHPMVSDKRVRHLKSKFEATCQVFPLSRIYRFYKVESCRRVVMTTA